MAASAQIPLRFEERPPALKVSDVVRAASRVLEGRFPAVIVEGEISGLRRHASGHLYFALKDDSAQLPAVTWKSVASRLRFTPRDGQAVRCRGSLSIYEPQGRFQFYAESMEPAGQGAAQVALEELKKRLAAEGLFDEVRKRKLPFWPRRIGVVTSATGAAVRDIIRVAHRRCCVPIVVAPSPVQGDAAAGQLVRSLRAVVSVPGVDVVIIGRGGGSAEDLSAFNDETLARAVAACPVPVVSAVGHEIDHTLCDYVADVRAATPSMAAERVTPVQDELEEQVATLARRARAAMLRIQREARTGLEAWARRLGDPRRALRERRQTIDDGGERTQRAVRGRVNESRKVLSALEARLAAQSPRARLRMQREQLFGLSRRLPTARRALLDERRHALERAATALHALSPLAVLERGYALARTPAGMLVTRADQITVGSPLNVTVREAELECRVEVSRPRRLGR